MVPDFSVCMAVKNGAPFIHDQVASILPQLAVDDELIISDDHSSDETIKIIRNFNDPRIKLLQNPRTGLVGNFENALNSAQGRYIFLADQDDIWVPDKISRTLPHLQTHDLVVSDCIVASESLEYREESFYRINGSQKGFFRNLLRNSYMGCCMAFHRKILSRALPFPESIPIHDAWLGLIAEIYFNVTFIDDKLVIHRRHDKNASTTSQKSRSSITDKVKRRLSLVKHIVAQSYES